MVRQDRAPTKLSCAQMPFVPRGLSRAQAAAYVGIGTTMFDELVEDGTLPPPFRLRGRKIWDRFRLDRAIDGLQPDAAPDPYADVC